MRVETDRKRDALAELGEIAGSVLHELRNPLGVIESSIYLIQKKPDDAARRDKHLKRMAEQIQHAKAVIAGLLDLLRDVPLHTDAVAVAVVLAAVTRDTTVEVEPTSARVQADATLLVQALRNLVDNALQWARSKVHVSVRARDAMIDVRVQDDGPGVPAELLPRLFQPLATSRPDGTGLGLSLCRRIAERHGGALCYSFEGGACFTLSLPVAR